jgi:putative addiction module component (TIGR02574 family)
MTLKMIKEQAISLPKKQRIKLVQELWDSIEVEPEDAPLSDAERRLLAQRLKKVQKSPTAGQPWEAVKKRVLKRIQGER